MNWVHLSTKQVTIRKPHLCSMCMTKYEPPTKMTYTTGLNDGDFISGYSCEVCEAYMTPEMWKNYDYEMPGGGLLEDPNYKPFREQYLKNLNQ